ncbi:MAG: magnesium transporter, partial [Defluviitaleaceae bacterium]|nr:magnesium transporter [Defluviitaleaceae bacterium]
VYVMNGRNLLLCVTVSLSLIAAVVIAKSTGCALPLLAKKLRIDPALMAAPLITTIADAASLIVYFSLATLILRI